MFLYLIQEPTGVQHLQTADLQMADLQTADLQTCRLQTCRLADQPMDFFDVDK